LASRRELKELKEIVEATIISKQLEEAWLEAIRRDGPLPSDLRSPIPHEKRLERLGLISHEEALEFLK
jgi:hypothetical protein